MTEPKANIPSVPRGLGFRVFSVSTLCLFVVIAMLPVLCAFLPGGSDGPQLAAQEFDAFRSIFLDSRQLTLLRNSLTVALGTTVAAGILGASAGFALEYLRVRARKLLMYGAATSFLVPPHIFAVAWIDLLGTNGILASALRAISPGIELWLPNLYSTSGVVFVLALSYYPVVTFATILAIRTFDRRMEEAALLVVTRVRAVLYIVLPSILPSILTGMLFVFIVSLVSFSVPSLLTVNVYTVEIYSRFSTFHNFQEGAALAIPLVICGGAAVALLRALGGRLSENGLSGSRREQIVTPVRGAAWVPATAGCGMLVLWSAVLPLAVLVVRAQPPGSFVTALETAKSEILTSLTLAAFSATVLCVLGFAIAYLARLGSTGLYRLSFLPFLVSGPVLGIGLIRVWNHSGALGVVYDSFAIVILACVGRYLVFAHHGTAAALADLHPNMEEAARVHGIPWHRQVTGIVFPLVLPTLIGVWGLGFVLSLAEVDAIILVYPPGFTTLGVRLFSLMHYGPSSTVAALCLINVFMVLGGAALLAYVYQRAYRSITNS